MSNITVKALRNTANQRQRNVGKARRAGPQQSGSHQGRKKKAPIPLRVLAVLSTPMIILHVINVALLSTFYSFLSFGFIILYLIAGYLGGNYWFADHPRFPRGEKPKAVQEGAACGFTLGVINLLVLVILVPVLSLVSISFTSIFAGLNALLCAPVEFFASLILGALGGLISERSR